MNLIHIYNEKYELYLTPSIDYNKRTVYLLVTSST